MEIGQLHQEMQAFCGQKKFLTRNIRNPYYSRRHCRQVVGKRKGLCNDVEMLLIKAGDLRSVGGVRNLAHNHICFFLPSSSLVLLLEWKDL